MLPLLERLKNTYLLWYGYYQILPKPHRYTLGEKIDMLFIEIIEAVSTASFVPGTQKIPFVILAIRKVDALKILLMVLWETKSLETKRYIALSRPIEEVGKMLGGWSGQLHRQNSPEQSGEKG